MRVEQVVMLEDHDKGMLRAAADAKAVQKIMQELSKTLKDGDDVLRKVASARDVDRPTLEELVRLFDTRIELLRKLPDNPATTQHIESLGAARASAREALQLVS